MDLFHKKQYSFPWKRSTVDAITQVTKIADSCKKKGQICVLVTLDIKNAFSTISWESIRKEMIRRSLPAKIRRLVNN
jgi:retron-type reverse transcriptase